MLELDDTDKDTDDDFLRAAAELERTRLLVGGFHVETAHDALGIWVVVDPGAPDGSLGPWTLPATVTPSLAATFQQTLAESGVTATVTVESLDFFHDGDTPVYRITFATAGDAEVLASRIMQTLPKPHPTMERLRQALTEAGVPLSVCLRDESVQVGTVPAEDVAALCRALGSPFDGVQETATADPDSLSRYAVQATAVLSAALGVPSVIEPVPVCIRCCTSHDNDMEITGFPLHAAERLADALEQAARAAEADLSSASSHALAQSET